jgi:hypothetical protein
VGTSLTILLGLYFHLTLYALALSLVISSCLGLFLLLRIFARPMRQLWGLAKTSHYNWWPEFSNLIWRYAISWCSGYFIFQLFTPLAFKFHGPVFAGKVGMSIAAWTAGYNIASTWLTAVTPKLNMLVAEKNWPQLDAVFNKNLRYSLMTMFLGGTVYFFLYFWMVDKIFFFKRLLGPLGMSILFTCWLLQLYINDLAVYLRSHKKEPLMLLSAVSAIYVAVTTYFCAYYLNEEMLFGGFLSSYFWGLPIVVMIWRKQKQAHDSDLV